MSKFEKFLITLALVPISLLIISVLGMFFCNLKYGSVATSCMNPVETFCFGATISRVDLLDRVIKKNKERLLEIQQDIDLAMAQKEIELKYAK